VCRYHRRGDAFVAGLLYGLAAGLELVPAITLAQRCGAATTAKGAMKPCPGSTTFNFQQAVGRSA
jgi:sugar/nucleoside kinase (ribokinase family)